MVNLPDLKTIARLLGGEVSKNRQVLAPGPGHSAADRSLCIKPDPNAPDGFLSYSFASDDPIECRDYIRNKLGLPAWRPGNSGNGGTHKHLSDEVITRAVMAAAAQPSHNSRAHVEKRYDYVDADGALLYQVERLLPKGFRQRRPDGNGGWIPYLDGITRVLYRLPDLLKYPDGAVFVTEGEKDADNVAALGLCTTTVSSGTWTNVDVEPLRGHDIIILQDNDGAGVKKALAAAQAVHGVAATTRIVLLPNLKPKEDVSDWIEADTRHHTADKLAEIAFAGPLWTPETAATSEEIATAPTTTAEVIHPPPPAESDLCAPFAWRDPATLPRRQWLYGKHYIRTYVSGTVGDGGVGKSTLVLTEAVIMALRRPLLGRTPEAHGPLRVWYWNGEDPKTEIELRLAAICQRFEVDGHDLVGQLFVDGRDSPLSVAAMKNGTLALNVSVLATIADKIKQNSIDVLILDPFVAVHMVPENDNMSQSQIIAALGRVAETTGISVQLVHHTRKSPPDQELSMSDARGASSFVDAVRSGRVLNQMTTKEAEIAGIEPTNRKRYFRYDKPKANMAPTEFAIWHHLTPVTIANGEEIAIVEPWQFPDMFAGVTAAHMQAVRKKVQEQDYRADIRAKNWVGYAVIEELKLTRSKRDKARAARILTTWFENNVLAKVTREDPKQRKEFDFVVPGDWHE